MTTPRSKKTSPLPEIDDHLSGIMPKVGGDEEKILKILETRKHATVLNLNDLQILKLSPLIEAFAKLRNDATSNVKEINLSKVTFLKNADQFSQLLAELAQNPKLSRVDLRKIRFQPDFTPEEFKEQLNKLDPKTQAAIKNQLNKGILKLDLEFKLNVIKMGAKPAAASPFLPVMKKEKEKKEYTRSSRATKGRSTDFSATDKKIPVLPSLSGDESNSAFNVDPSGRSSAQSQSGHYYNSSHYPEPISVLNGMVGSLDALRVFEQLATKIHNNPGNAASKHQVELFKKIDVLIATNVTEHLNANEKREAATLIGKIVENDFYLKTISLNHNDFSVEHLRIIFKALLDAKTKGSPLAEINLQNCFKKEDFDTVAQDLIALKQAYGKNAVKLDAYITEKMDVPARKSISQKTTSPLLASSHFSSNSPLSQDTPRSSGKLKLPPLDLKKPKI